jgi:hypothetical protein
LRAMNLWWWMSKPKKEVEVDVKHQKKHVKISKIDQWPFQNFTKLNWRCLPYLFHYIYTYIYIHIDIRSVL